MARWSETRGYTLVLSHPRAPDRYARLTLVNKRTLLGQAFNIMEARAEDASRSGREPEGLGAGRMLSWRWLGEREADGLLAARLRTLEALGYRVLGEATHEQRGAWDWLRDLVGRQLARGGEPGESAGESETGPQPEGLREALEHLGLEPSTLVEGIATVMGLEEAQLCAPDLEILRQIEPEMLEILLPFWVEHESAQLRRIGRRWFALGPTPYEIDVAVLESWAAREGALANAIADRLEAEGLALLGPEGLPRLAHKAIEPRTRAICAQWQRRLRPIVRVPG